MTQGQGRRAPDAEQARGHGRARPQTGPAATLEKFSKPLTKKERLAQELRQNLNRRKAQARARAAAQEGVSPDPDPPADGHTNC